MIFGTKKCRGNWGKKRRKFHLKLKKKKWEICVEKFMCWKSIFVLDVLLLLWLTHTFNCERMCVCTCERTMYRCCTAEKKPMPFWKDCTGLVSTPVRADTHLTSCNRSFLLWIAMSLTVSPICHLCLYHTLSIYLSLTHTLTFICIDVCVCVCVCVCVYVCVFWCTSRAHASI